MKSLLKLKQTKKIAQKYKKNMELVQIYLENFNKILIITY